MNGISYSLTLENKNADYYYDAIKVFSNKIKEKIIFGGNEYLNEFMQFIISENLEQLRSKEEYGLELLFIGIMLDEYIDNVRHFLPITKKVLTNLNRFSAEYKEYREKLESIREKLCLLLLMKKKHVNREVTMSDFHALINWMEASGEFAEEVNRLKNWKLFLDDNGKYYGTDMLIYCKILATQFYEECKYSLEKYNEVINYYIDTCKKYNDSNKNISYIGKGEIQYFFNLISGEIINDIYRNEFLKSNEKIVLLHDLDMQHTRGCNNNYKDNYIIKELDILKKEKRFKILEEKDNIHLPKVDSKDERYGILNVSCILTLFSQCLKTISLGYKPQNIIINYCICKDFNNDIIKTINNSEINSILKDKE